MFTLGKFNICFWCSPADTCFLSKGTSVCFSNTYPGSYKQWGCGASSTGTTVATSYTGMDSAMQLQIVMTGGLSTSSSAVSYSSAAATSSLPATTNTQTSANKASLTTTASQSSQAVTTRPSSPSSSPNSGGQATATESTSDSPNASPSSIVDSGNQLNTTASTNATSTGSSIDTKKSSAPIAPIVGGVVGGVAVFAGIVALCFICARRKWFNRIQRDQARLYSPANSHHNLHQTPPMGAVPPRHQTPPVHRTPGHSASAHSLPKTPKSAPHTPTHPTPAKSPKSTAHPKYHSPPHHSMASTAKSARPKGTFNKQGVFIPDAPAHSSKAASAHTGPAAGGRKKPAPRA
jgi:hypothetical protein